MIQRQSFATDAAIQSSSTPASSDLTRPVKWCTGTGRSDCESLASRGSAVMRVGTIGPKRATLRMPGDTLEHTTNHNWGAFKCDRILAWRFQKWSARCRARPLTISFWSTRISGSWRFAQALLVRLAEIELRDC